jgi:hypothetical protein
MLEEKQIPYTVEKINMRCYGDKPASFLTKVPSGLLPVLEIDGSTITESAQIMQLLEKEFPDCPMLPAEGSSLRRCFSLGQLLRNLHGLNAERIPPGVELPLLQLLHTRRHCPCLACQKPCKVCASREKQHLCSHGQGYTPHAQSSAHTLSSTCQLLEENKRCSEGASFLLTMISGMCSATPTC